MGRNYDSYGIWADTADNVYLTMIDSKKVIRIGAEGRSETIISTNSLWTVCSGLFDDNGNMWVLENSATNEVRARKISQQDLAAGKLASNSAVSPHLLITIFTGVAVIVLFLAAKIILAKRRNNKVQFSF
jgi:hypothetical protein